jgi:putative addiction module CopG family antidote
MNINLPPDTQAFLQQLVQSGKYQTENEAIVDALQRFQAREQLSADVEAGFRQVERGEWVDGDEVLDEIEAEIDAMIAKQKAGESNAAG